MPQHKIAVYVPVADADAVRAAIGTAGGGAIGNYRFCSFSAPGTGRFRPVEGARPAIGAVGRSEEVAEERIECVCDSALVPAVVRAIVKAHPYEEVAMDVWPLEDWKQHLE